MIISKKDFIGVIDMFKNILPRNKKEIYLFSFLFIFYFSYSILLVFKTSVIDHQSINTDIYFSFDNPYILKNGSMYRAAHPLMYYYVLPFLIIGNFFITIGMYKAKTILFVVICNILITLSSVYIYRYLKEIVKLNAWGLIIHTFIYSFASTNLILCFTPESYTCSAFFLIFIVYYYSSKIKSKESVDILSSAILSIWAGGITITNFAKGIIPILFLKDNFTSKLKKILFAGCLFSIPILYMVYKGWFFQRVQFSLEMSMITNDTSVSILDQIIHFFLAAPIFFPQIITSLIQTPSYSFESIALDYFSHWWQLIIIIPIFLLMIISIIKNVRNRFVQMIISLFLVDVIIHFIIQFGLDSSFIYGAHWIYIVPLLLGWLWSTLKTKKMQNIYLIFISIIFSGLLINNLYQLSTFIRLAINNFPEG